MRDQSPGETSQREPSQGERAPRDTRTMRFGYRAANASGAVSEGEIEAASEQQAIDALRRRSLWATDVWSTQARTTSKEKRSAPAGSLAAMTRAIAALLTSGVTLEEALSYAANNSPGTIMREAFAGVRNDVRNGKSLRDALAARRFFPPLFPALASAGEATGSLSQSFERLAEHLERTDALRARLRSALLYPALLGAAAIIGTSVIMLIVVPRFAVLLEQAGSAIPLSTRILLATSRIAIVAWPVVALATVAAVLAFRSWSAAPANRQRWHRSRLNWPMIGSIERATAAARYTRTLSLALPGGVNLLAAMALARDTVDNLAIRSELETAEQQVRGGRTLAASVAHVLPPLAVQLLSAGEASGALGALSARAADALDAEVQQSLSRSVTLIEPALILVFGGVIGFVALGLLQAIYGMNASAL